MQVIFNKTVDLSFNGCDTKTYESGVVYNIEHPQERVAFNLAIEEGYAKKYDPDVDNRPTPQETKVAQPRSGKAKQ
jgi:hypothetical protein